MGSQVVFEKDMSATMKQSDFLSNDKNKDRLIDFLTIQLTTAGIAVKQGSQDADRLRVVSAIEQLNDHDKVAVAGQDVDLLVLLIALTLVDREICFIKEGSKQGDYTLFSTKTHQHLKDTILVSHAFTGCDTTSFIFHWGKKTFLNLLNKNSKLRDDTTVFTNPDSSRDSIKQAGEMMMLALYGAGKDKTCINSYRYECFVGSTARFKTEVRLAQLPPTRAATEEHSLRVFLQVQKWLGNDHLRPIDWGWDLQDGMFFPTMTKEPPAPEDILKMIHCTCKGNCAKRCGCRKAGLKCSTICLGCHGNSCSNSKAIDIDCDTPESSNDSGQILLNDIDSLIHRHIEKADDDEEFPAFTMPPA